MVQVLQLLSGSPIASRLMCLISLPSTLVVSLMALTEMVFDEDEEWDNEAVEAENRLATLLSSLCASEAAVKDLISATGSVPTLFVMVSRPEAGGSARVAQHALAALDVIVTHRLSGKQVSYLCNAKCVSSQLGVLVAADLPPFSLEFRLTVLQLFAKYMEATCMQTSDLMDAFIEAKGFELVLDIILWLSRQEGSEASLHLVLTVVSHLTYVGFNAEIDSGSHPSRVQCLAAFRVLPEAIKTCKHTWLQARILEHMYAVYMKDPANATIVERVHPLAAMLVPAPASLCPAEL